MKQLFLVTGNPNKLIEWRQLLPSEITIDSVDIDLPEIQSADPEEVVADKAKRAYEASGKPVVVEDVSAGLEKLGGLPGPFVKFFLKSMGEDTLYTLAGKAGEKAVVSCAIAYYDGNQLLTVRADINGTVTPPRGTNGFGFDKTFMPDDHTKTYAEMTPEEKNAVSHRSKAIAIFIEQLTSTQEG